MKKTDVSLNDQKKGLVGSTVDFQGKKVVQHATTPGLLQARRNAALNFQTLVLGEMLRYGEVVVSYRKHDGGFPKFARFDKTRKLWKAGFIGPKGYAPFKDPEQTFPDAPT
jgi:hypothetical protein